MYSIQGALKMAKPITPAMPPATRRTRVRFQPPPSASSAPAKPTQNGISGSFSPIAMPVIRPAMKVMPATLPRGPFARVSRLQTRIASPIRISTAITLS